MARLASAHTVSIVAIARITNCPSEVPSAGAHAI
jgi:hypothetical protein